MQCRSCVYGSLKPSRYNIASIFILDKSQTAEGRSIQSTMYKSICIEIISARMMFFSFRYRNNKIHINI